MPFRSVRFLGKARKHYSFSGVEPAAPTHVWEPLWKSNKTAYPGTARFTPHILLCHILISAAFEYILELNMYFLWIIPLVGSEVGGQCQDVQSI